MGYKSRDPFDDRCGDIFYGMGKILIRISVMVCIVYCTKIIRKSIPKNDTNSRMSRIPLFPDSWLGIVE